MADFGRRVHRPIAAMVTLIALAVVSCNDGTSPTSSSAPTVDHSRSSPSSSPARWPQIMDPAPAGFSAPAATWLTITGEDGQTQVAAEFRPRAHRLDIPSSFCCTGRVGSHGRSSTGRRGSPPPALSSSSAAIWMVCARHASESQRVPRVPRTSRISSRQHPSTVQKSYRNLLDAASRRPGVKPGVIGVVGVSGRCKCRPQQRRRARDAIVADSGYRTTPGTAVAPVLVLGMTADPNVDHALLVRFEQAQQSAGRPVDTHYYPGNGHVVILGAPACSRRRDESHHDIPASPPAMNET